MRQGFFKKLHRSRGVDSPLKALTVTFLAPRTDRSVESIADGHFNHRSFPINSRLFKKHLFPVNVSVTSSTINFSSTLVSMEIPLACSRDVSAVGIATTCYAKQQVYVVYTCTFGISRLTFEIVRYVGKEVPSYVLFPAAILFINYTGQKWSVGYHSSDWSLT